MKEPRTGLVFLFLILAFSAWRSLSGIDSLIPYFINLDEAYIVKSALRVLQTGDFNPHFFKYGGLSIYLCAGIYSLYFHGWALVSGREASELIQGFFYEDQGFALFYLGRFLCLAFGLLSVGMVYLIGRSLWDRRVALLAALFLAVSPVYLERSQFLNVDVMVTFWVLLSVYLALRWRDSDNPWCFIGSAVFSGLAIATKYNFLSFLPLLAVVIIRARERGKTFFFSGLGRTLLAGYIATLAFFLASPFCFLDFPGFYREVAGFFRFHQVPHFSYLNQILYRSYLYQVVLLFPLVFGPVLYPAAVGGAAILGKRDKKLLLILLSFPLGFFLFGGGIMLYQFPYYFLPLLPFGILLGLHCAFYLWSQPSRAKRWAGMFILVGSLLYFLSDIVLPQYRTFYSLHRELGEWVERAKREDNQARILMAGWFFPPSQYFRKLGLERLESEPDFHDGTVILENPDYLITLGARTLGEDAAFFRSGSYWKTCEDLARGRFRYRLSESFGPPRAWSRVAEIFVPLVKSYRYDVFRRTRPYSREEKREYARARVLSGDREEISRLTKLIGGLEPDLQEYLRKDD